MTRARLLCNARKSDEGPDLGKSESTARSSCAVSEMDPRPEKADGSWGCSAGRSEHDLTAEKLHCVW